MQRKTYGERNNALRIEEPGVPSLLVNADAVDAFYRGLVERVARGQLDGYSHHLVVDFVPGVDFLGSLIYFDGQGLGVGGLGGDPVVYSVELGGDD